MGTGKHTRYSALEHYTNRGLEHTEFIVHWSTTLIRDRNTHSYSALEHYTN